MGNTTLVEYGIQTIKADLCAHVCIMAKRVYVYPTQYGVKLIESGDYQKTSARTGKYITAEGYLIPANVLPVRGVIPDWLIDKINFSEADTTTVKGQKATQVVSEMLQMGIFPIPFTTEMIVRHADQIHGVDIRASANVSIQVKCDYRGGHKHLGGTGNLFLQVTECNPNDQH